MIHSFWLGICSRVKSLDFYCIGIWSTTKWWKEREREKVAKLSKVHLIKVEMPQWTVNLKWRPDAKLLHLIDWLCNAFLSNVSNVIQYSISSGWINIASWLDEVLWWIWKTFHELFSLLKKKTARIGKFQFFNNNDNRYVGLLTRNMSNNE